MKKSLAAKAAGFFAAAIIAAASAVSMSASAGWEQIGFMGDLNRDKQLTVADLLLLSKHLLCQQQLTHDNDYQTNGSFIGINGEDGFKSGDFLRTADINQDGVVNSFDMILMRKHLSEKSGFIVWQWEDDPIQTTTSSLPDPTTLTTTAAPADDTFIDPPIKPIDAYLPSQGTGNLVIFYVDFPDCQFPYSPSADVIDEIAFGPEDLHDKNYPFDSMSAFFSRSSKGAMNLKGKAFTYTAKQNVAHYGEIREELAKECFKAFDSFVDFSKFDGDGDGYIDTVLINVPTAAGDEFWWPCAGPMGQDYFRIDGKKIGHFITGNAQIESPSDYKNFNSSYLHEMGHCMGLPDYYLYEKEDYEGLHGTGGTELMDVDASSDFGCASKLQLGWYRKSQIQVYDPNGLTQSFKLTNAQTDGGNCLIIPNGSLDDAYHSEYFILEYSTPDRNNSHPMYWVRAGRGIRVYHVSAELYNNGWWTSFRYESGSDFTANDAGRRFIRIIDDRDVDNLYRSGDVIDNSIAGFNWYNSSDVQSIDPGIVINVGELIGDSYTVTVSRK